MKALIVYFSGTGNTEMITSGLVSRLIAQGWDVDAVSVETYDDNSRDFNFNLRTMDLLGFGFPVYKLSYPVIMEKIFPFLSNLKPSQKPFFVFSTFCRFPSTALHRMAKSLELTETADPGRHHVPVALRAFKCPSNGIASLKDPDSPEYREVMYFSPGIGRQADQFTSEIIAGVERYYRDKSGLRHRGSPLDRFKENLVGKIEHSRYPFLTVDPESCIGCGLCAKRCPEDNLVMQDKLAVPRDATGCLHCLRCLHICPKLAISFGPLVQGPSRYSPAIRKKLYVEADKLPVSAKERGSRIVKMRWALRSLRS